MSSWAAAQPNPLEEEDDDKYAWRMNDPLNDFLAARRKLSSLCKDNHTQHECAAGALGRSLGSLWPTTRPYSISGEGQEIMVNSKR